MNSLKTLSAIVIGAILLSVTFALATKDRGARVNVKADEGRSMHHTENGDEGEFVLKQGSEILKAKWKGGFKVNLAGTDIETLDKYLEITVKEAGVERQAIFKKHEGETYRKYYIDDDKQEPGEETDAAIADLLVHFLRASGMSADERVAGLLESGGVDAVLVEIDLLEGDHACRRYIAALTEQADLNDEQITRLAEHIKRMDSNHDTSRALQAILENETISPPLIPILLGAADGIDSSHDLRKLTESFATRPLNAEAIDLSLELYRRIDSDHDMRHAAIAILANDALDDEGAAKILAAAAEEIDSSHDLRELLTQTSERYAKSTALREAWLAGFAEIDSSHDKRMALTAIAEEGDLTADDWRALILATAQIDSSHDQRMALTAIAEHFDNDEALLEAYHEAAARIDSDHDREQALAALGD